MFQIVLTNNAVRELKKFDRIIQKRLATAIDQLQLGLNGNCKKLQGQKLRYRLRVGDYRILFEVHQERLLILVIRMGHRREIYERR